MLQGEEVVLGEREDVRFNYAVIITGIHPVSSASSLRMRMGEWEHGWALRSSPRAANVHES